MKVALSGGWDSYYQEVIEIDDAQDAYVDVSSWRGFAEGANPIFVQIIVEDPGASATVSELSFRNVAPNLTNPPQEIRWRETFDTVHSWTTYQSVATTNDIGTAELYQSGNNEWGKFWTYAGRMDVDLYRYLNVVIADVNGIAKIAVSGEYDTDYWEPLSVTSSGTYQIDLASWPGNRLGNNEVFVQLIVEGQNAHTEFDEIAISRVMSQI